MSRFIWGCIYKLASHSRLTLKPVLHSLCHWPLEGLPLRCGELRWSPVVLTSFSQLGSQRRQCDLPKAELICTKFRTSSYGENLPGKKENLQLWLSFVVQTGNKVSCSEMRWILKSPSWKFWKGTFNTLPPPPPLWFDALDYSFFWWGSRYL